MTSDPATAADIDASDVEGVDIALVAVRLTFHFRDGAEEEIIVPAETVYDDEGNLMTDDPAAIAANLHAWSMAQGERVH